MRIFVLVSVVIGIFLGGLFFVLKKKPKDNNAFIVGTAAAYAPFVSINEQGQYEGFDIDVARELAQLMGKKLEIRDLGSMTSLFLGLEQGEIDVIVWGLSIIPERLAKVAMIPYQGEKITTYQLLFWNKIPDGITSISDLKGKVVCVEVGSAQEQVLFRYPDVVQKPMDKVVDALMEIQYGKADAAFVEPAVARKFKEKFSAINVLDVPLKKEEQELGTGIAIRKDRTELIEQIQKAVKELKQNGVLDILETKWGLE